MKGCWWQQPDVVRQRYTNAGIPVDVLERNGKFAIYNFSESLPLQGRTRASWISGQCRRMTGKDNPSGVLAHIFWISGKITGNSFFAYKSQLHDVLCQLPGIILCPCITTPLVAEGTTHLLNLPRSSPRHLVIDEAKPDADAHGCELNFPSSWPGRGRPSNVRFNRRAGPFERGDLVIQRESKCGDVLTLRRKTNAPRGRGWGQSRFRHPRE